MVTLLKSIIIRGVEYKSQSAASLALNVSTSAISQSIKRGKVDTIGLGTLLKPIIIRGVQYASYSAAALALNVSREAISQAVKRGRQDTIGVGMGKSPIVWDGVQYDSLKAAAYALKLPIHKFRILRDSLAEQRRKPNETDAG